MTFIAKFKAERFFRKAESLAQSFQMELWKSSETVLSERYDESTASKLAAAISNYVMYFDDRAPNPSYAQDETLMRLLATEKMKVFAALRETFKTNATGVLILWAAAQGIPHDVYSNKMKSLADEGFAQIGSKTPNVAVDLPKEDLWYCYELSAIGDFPCSSKT